MFWLNMIVYDRPHRLSYHHCHAVLTPGVDQTDSYSFTIEITRPIKYIVLLAVSIQKSLILKVGSSCRTDTQNVKAPRCTGIYTKRRSISFADSEYVPVVAARGQCVYQPIRLPGYYTSWAVCSATDYKTPS